MAETGEPPLLAPELAERLDALFASLGLTMPGGAEGFAQAALRRGIGLVDPSRQSALVDLRVYAGACWRLNRWRELAEAKTDAALPAFARDVIRSAWMGAEGGADIQESAAKHGLIVEAPYDPAVHGHGPGDWAEPGEPIWTFVGWLKDPADG